MMEYVNHNLFSTDAGVIWLALKWVLVVLVAGFIGQFGKDFATYLMRRARARKAPEVLSQPEAPPEAAGLQRPALQEKSFPAQAAMEPSVRLKSEKKEKKALAKQQKKLLKKLSK